MHIRATTRTDFADVDALLARSYPVLLKPDYPPSVLVTALPIISRARPELVSCGTYFGVFEGDQLRAAGGWTLGTPGGGRSARGLANIRHVVTDHTRTRRGFGRGLMAQIFKTARAAGVLHIMCQSTLTAEPFYAAMGFERVQDITVPLRGGIDFSAVAMQRQL